MTMPFSFQYGRDNAMCEQGLTAERPAAISLRL
jgi:hypothetical protein